MGPTQCGLTQPIRLFIPFGMFVSWNPRLACCSVYLALQILLNIPLRSVFDGCFSPLFSSFSPLLHLLSFFSVCMTNSEKIPNCGRPEPAAPPPAFSWQDGSCLTFNHECFARQLGLGEIQWGNSGNLTGWARQRTVNPLRKDRAVTTMADKQGNRGQLVLVQPETIRRMRQ